MENLVSSSLGIAAMITILYLFISTKRHKPKELAIIFAVLTVISLLVLTAIYY